MKAPVKSSIAGVGEVAFDDTAVAIFTGCGGRGGERKKLRNGPSSFFRFHHIHTSDCWPWLLPYRPGTRSMLDLRYGAGASGDTALDSGAGHRRRRYYIHYSTYLGREITKEYTVEATMRDSVTACTYDHEAMLTSSCLTPLAAVVSAYRAFVALANLSTSRRSAITPPQEVSSAPSFCTMLATKTAPQKCSLDEPCFPSQS